jgi:hypothetical protein
MRYYVVTPLKYNSKKENSVIKQAYTQTLQ